MCFVFENATTQVFTPCISLRILNCVALWCSTDIYIYVDVQNYKNTMNLVDQDFLLNLTAVTYIQSFEKCQLLS